MAVLVEALSVIVRRDRIEEKYSGGWSAFKKSIPNATFCADDEIAAVAFMSPNDVQAYVNRLERKGLVFLSHQGSWTCSRGPCRSAHGSSSPG